MSQRPLLSSFWALLTLLSLLALAVPAYADSPADLRRARAQFQRGIELEQASNWSEAIQQFREVGSVRMTPQVRFHIAYCEENLGRLVTALGGYELALAEAEQVGSDFKGEVETAITRLRERIPKLLIERGTGADAAAVHLDGVALGGNSVGVEIPLDPGPHNVSAIAPGFKPFTATVELKEREVTRLAIELEPQPVPPPDAGGPKQVIVVTRTEAPKRLVPYVIGGAGVAALVAGGVLFALHESAESELKRKCPDPDACPESNRPTYDRMVFYSWTAPVTAGVGVAAIGVAVSLIVFEKKKAPESGPTAARLELSPSAPGSLAGISMRGQF
jgi:hypothetical protein